MKKLGFISFLLCSSLFGSSQLTSENVLILRIFEEEVSINGIIEMGEWPAVDSIVGLISPWDLSDDDQTIFKAFYTDSYLFFYFKVVDTTLTLHEYRDELTVTKEDRVELFLSATPDMKQYYCIEIDPLGRILDYSAQHYRMFDESWDFKQTKIGSSLTPNGYIVEGRLSLNELNLLGLTDNFNLGIFRADFIGNINDDVIWYSWIDPQNKIPDFHIPSSLNKVSFVNTKN